MPLAPDSTLQIAEVVVANASFCLSIKHAITLLQFSLPPTALRIDFKYRQMAPQ